MSEPQVATLATRISREIYANPYLQLQPNLGYLSILHIEAHLINMNSLN